MVLTDDQGHTVQLVAGAGVIIQRALYGYRKSPQLWQRFVGSCLRALALQQSAVEATIFYTEDFSMIVIFHVDDFMFAGLRSRVENLITELQKVMKMRVEASLYNVGDTGMFLNRTVVRTERGFRVRGNLRVIDSLLRQTDQQNARYISTPSVHYTLKPIEGAPLLKDVTPFRSVVG